MSCVAWQRPRTEPWRGGAQGPRRFGATVLVALETLHAQPWRPSTARPFDARSRRKHDRLVAPNRRRLCGGSNAAAPRMSRTSSSWCTCIATSCPRCDHDPDDIEILSFRPERRAPRRGDEHPSQRGGRRSVLSELVALDATTGSSDSCRPSTSLG
jgi:hypothetical protein